MLFLFISGKKKKLKQMDQSTSSNENYAVSDQPEGTKCIKKKASASRKPLYDPYVCFIGREAKKENIDFAVPKNFVVIKTTLSEFRENMNPASSSETKNYCLR